MKPVKTLLAAALMATGMATAHAQATYTDRDGNEYQFKKHWFLDVQAGGQYTLGEAKFGDLLSPNFQGAIGYQFSPVVGVRAQANGLWSRGGWAGFRAKVGDKPYNATYKYKYVAPGLDVMVNLSNLFCGWNPMRTLNVSAFLGGGVNWAGGNGEVNNIAATLKNVDDYNLEYLWQGKKVRPFGRAGVDVAIRINNTLSFMVEGNANIISDKYNSKKAGNADWYFNALAGVRINLGKSYTKRQKPQVIETEPQQVVEPAPQTVAPVEQPKAETVEVKKVEEIRRDVFFVINSKVVAKAEQDKIKEVVDYLNSYPEAKVTVTGYADAGTGNNTINDRLAAQRANAVVKVLTEQYGIAKDRITSDSKGARVQPFAENAKNRVSIVIAK